MAAWGSPVEVERRRRIRVAAWAYAYEMLDTSLVEDAVFDRECLLVDPSVLTGNHRLDRFFREVFAPHTGMWVREHPDQPGLDRLCRRLIAPKETT